MPITNLPQLFMSATHLLSFVFHKRALPSPPPWIAPAFLLPDIRWPGVPYSEVLAFSLSTLLSPSPPLVSQGRRGAGLLLRGRGGRRPRQQMAQRRARRPRRRRAGAGQGRQNVVVAVGESVQAGVDRCPRGGSVLLQPGAHSGPLVLSADQSVHVFGRGRACLSTLGQEVVRSAALEATLDGLAIVCDRDAPFDEDEDGELDLNGDREACCVTITGGRLRLQACFVRGAPHAGVFADTGSDPVVTGCR